VVLSDADDVRIAVVGVGRMGAVHARELSQGNVRRARLSAVCDTDPAALARFPDVPRFAQAEALLSSGLADAVLIATPHYDHTPLAIAALAAGLHVLCEKPLAVHQADCLKMLAAYQSRPRPGQVFAEMLSLRAEPRFLKLRAMILAGELGTVLRMNWILTDWFRTESYYRSASWRATWRGEGGGVLLNQCSHALDLWQWLFGMPKRVHAFCDFGRFHQIEVEDQVSAFLEYEPGKTGVFVTSTAEAPGTNRLEVAGDLGKVVLDAAGLTYTQNAASTIAALQQGAERQAMPSSTTQVIRLPACESPRNLLIQNFVAAILEGEPLIAPASEGIASVELANALLYSGFTRQTVDLPLDPALYASELARRIAGSHPGA
jgi:predicted dehydrogenase